VAVWLPPFAGALGWTAQLLTVFALGSAICRLGEAGGLAAPGVTVAAGALTLAALAVGIRSGEAGAGGFVARTGVYLNGLFLFLILLGGAGGLMLHPCH
jgi:hypothetical protein